MNKTIINQVKSELCPEGVWQLTNTVESILKFRMSRLPKDNVSDTETRYPTTLAGMRAFLDVFFARHYFQIQNSLFEYMTSNEFIDTLISGKLQILDIGCGPAVASLAITDMLSCILRNLREVNASVGQKPIKMSYVLNDTSGICLGTSQYMLNDYFRMSKNNDTGIVHSQTFRIQKAFPENLDQLRRITLNLAKYNMIILSYVAVPLSENDGYNSLINGLLNTQNLCHNDGRILILQDRFQEKLVRKISRSIGVSSRKNELTQNVYSRENSSEAYTYSYFECLYPPDRKESVKTDYAA